MWLWLLANGVALGGLAMEVANLACFPRLKPTRDAHERVDVYVAMRDEGENAAAFLDAVLASDDVASVVVGDDGSSDATPAILDAYARRDARVHVVTGGARGGKSAMLARAVEAHPPGTPWLLFLDADVRIAPACAATLVAYARQMQAAAATAWLRVAPQSLASALLAPAVTLFLLQALPMRLARGSDPRFAAGNGQCFLVRADAYAACGGHAALDAVVEDVALARALKAAGHRVALASGAEIATVCGYETLAQNARGLGRSLYYGTGALGCVLFAIWQLLLACAPLPLWAARIITARRLRETSLSVVLAPLGALAAAGAALLAAWEGARGRIGWRGRSLALGETGERS
ncbi:MAG: glycosyltransferase [bacterium]|nr:glycosyltransferase [bacterium]